MITGFNALLSRLCLWMRAHLTDVHQFGIVHGHYKDSVQWRSVSLFKEDGKWTLSNALTLWNLSISYSLLPALLVDGIIHAKIVEGSFTAGHFYDFIDGLLDHMQPFPLPNSVVIMDNAHIHKDPQVLDLILEQLVILPFSFACFHSSYDTEECNTCSCHTPLTTTLLNLLSPPSKLLYDMQENLEEMILILMLMTLMFTYPYSVQLFLSVLMMQQTIITIVAIC